MIPLRAFRDLEPDECTLPRLLLRQAESLGSRTLVSIGGRLVTAPELVDVAARRAATLRAHGVEAGDRVALLSSNRFELLELWLGAAWLGAVPVPCNASLRGAQLQHVLESCDPRLLVVELEQLPHTRILERSPRALERVWALDAVDPDDAWHGVAVEPVPPPLDPVDPHPARAGDLLTIIYTSGTTGASKGVCCPHAQLFWWGLITAEQLGLTPDDVNYTASPLFHVGPFSIFYQAVLSGALAHFSLRYSVSRFWDEVRSVEATVGHLLGAMVRMLLEGGRDPGEGHRLRAVISPGITGPAAESFERRFGVRVMNAWGSTETNHVISVRPAYQRPGYMGKVLPGFEARVVDPDDAPVPDGTPGELVLRADRPFSFSTGYFRDSEATVDAWRNLWFHTGDRVVREPDGWLRFVDRIKESIRRRGVNISAFEVEQVLEGHPAVEAAAVVPVPAEVSEDEVMAFLMPRAGAEAAAPEDLIRYCEPRLAYFAIPRYVEWVADLPLTESGKVAKGVLRERGVSEATWDREAAGYRVHRGAVA